MLSSTAKNLYWMGRYLQRAENMARLLEATQRTALHSLGLDHMEALLAGQEVALVIRPPPVHTPIAVPRLVRKKFSNTRATRLRHQPFNVCTSSRRAMKSA